MLGTASREVEAVDLPIGGRLVVGQIGHPTQAMVMLGTALAVPGFQAVRARAQFALAVA